MLCSVMEFYKLKPISKVRKINAGELIFFDFLHTVFFKLHFAGNSITTSCPVIRFIIKKRPLNSNNL